MARVKKYKHTWNPFLMLSLKLDAQRWEQDLAPSDWLINVLVIPQVKAIVHKTCNTLQTDHVFHCIGLHTLDFYQWFCIVFELKYSAINSCRMHTCESNFSFDWIYLLSTHLTFCFPWYDFAAIPRWKWLFKFDCRQDQIWQRNLSNSRWKMGKFTIKGYMGYLNCSHMKLSAECSTSRALVKGTWPDHFFWPSPPPQLTSKFLRFWYQ